jgi:hypothetical protein
VATSLDTRYFLSW